MPTASAKEAAVIFAASVKHAGLIDDEGNIRIDVTEVPAELEPETSSTPKTAKVTKTTGETTSGTPVLPVAPPPAAATVANPATLNAPPLPATPPGSVPPVGVNVTIDMSKWQADDVLRVLGVLGYEAPSGPK